MRMRLLETARPRRWRPGGTLTSVAAHAVVILLAVYASARGEPTPTAPPAEPARVIYTATTRPTPPRPMARTDGPIGGSGPIAPTSPELPPIPAPRLPRLPVFTGAPTLPPIATGAPVTADEFARGGRPPTGGASGGLRSGGGPLGIHEVERPAAPRSHIEPRYPEPLRARGVAGAVVVRFVVDTTGRLAPGSLEVVAATDSLFADAVRDALGRARFTPAEVAGRPVPQLVEQRFEFRMGRR
ncbi:MAG TPA: energy transducer TonB [Gemmatimonadaceae bacterium]|nr:energy transducer TonB [Gemmatimonadaceae bacterium]